MGKSNELKKKHSASDDLRPEYEFDYSKACRGKYHKRLIKEGAIVIVPESIGASPSRAASLILDKVFCVQDTGVSEDP